jgi:hypothetical protein
MKAYKRQKDKSIKGRTKQQQTKQKQKRKQIRKNSFLYPLSLVRMNIYDLAKYYRQKKYKNTFRFTDVYSRNVWAYKMKK